MLGEAMHNYPKEYEKEPWCPHTELIQICALLAGIEFTPETFCYETGENTVYSEGDIPWLEHIHYYPKASCATVSHKLSQQMKLVEKDLTLTPEDIIVQEIDNAQTLDEKKVVIGKYNQEKTLQSQKTEVLSRWRETVYKICCSTPGDEKNHHFRQITSANELSESEVIDRVKSFAGNLSKIIGYSEEQMGWFLDEVQNCPQGPTSWYF